MHSRTPCDEKGRSESWYSVGGEGFASDRYQLAVSANPVRVGDLLELFNVRTDDVDYV